MPAELSCLVVAHESGSLTWLLLSQLTGACSVQQQPCWHLELLAGNGVGDHLPSFTGDSELLPEANRSSADSGACRLQSLGSGAFFWGRVTLPNSSSPLGLVVPQLRREVELGWPQGKTDKVFAWGNGGLLATTEMGTQTPGILAHDFWCFLAALLQLGGGAC